MRGDRSVVVVVRPVQHGIANNPPSRFMSMRRAGMWLWSVPHPKRMLAIVHRKHTRGAVQPSIYTRNIFWRHRGWIIVIHIPRVMLRAFIANSGLVTPKMLALGML